MLRGDTGARLDILNVAGSPIKLLNSQTDRLYLCTETGLLQCLREIEQVEPIRHGEARRKAAAGKIQAAEQQGLQEEGLDAMEKAADPDGGAEGAEDPLGGGGDDGGDDGGDEGGDEGGDAPIGDDAEDADDPFGDDDPFN